MLTRLRLESFKSFTEAEAPFGPLTLLIGANASGKTNVLEALRLLGALLGDLHPLDHALRDAGVVRGGAREVARNGSDTFSIRSTWRGRTDRIIDHELTCLVRPELQIRSEQVMDRGDVSVWLRAHALLAPLADLGGKPAGPAGLLEWPFPDQPSSGPAGVATSSRLSAVWSAFRVIPGSPDESGGRESPVRRLAQELSEALQALQFLNITPSQMRDYAPLDSAPLDSDGENLSAVLFRFCEDPDAKRSLVDWLSALCVPELADIEFSRTDEGSVMLRAIEKEGIRVSARSLSDGTLRFLGELIALRTAPAGSVILMEELGRDVHPRRMHLLVEYLESVTEERGIQVIATTHSPDVLAALGPRARADAILLGRVPDAKGTVMRRLGDLAHFEEVVERRGLADLFTMGWLEQAL